MGGASFALNCLTQAIVNNNVKLLVANNIHFIEASNGLCIDKDKSFMGVDVPEYSVVEPSHSNPGNLDSTQPGIDAMAVNSNSRTVPFFNYSRAYSDREDEYVALFKDVLRRGAFILQKDLSDFEQHLADYLKVKHVIGLGNCTDALVIALRAVGIQSGDEVIFPSHTMVASPSAIAMVGATPVPVDCGDDHLIDPQSIKKAITRKTRAIMPVQLNGRTANMDAIQEIADTFKLLIVEDSAQGLGSQFKGKFAGTFGVAGTFSFYPAKILGCMGDGGALVTNDDEVAHFAKLFRDHGRNDEGEVELWAGNSRLDNLQAAFLDLQLKDFAKIIERRRSIAARYEERLGSIDELKLPPAPGADPDHFDTYQNYEIEANRRNELKAFLKDNGIGTLIQWGGKAVHQFEALNLKVHLPNTERLFTQCLMLPMNLTLSDEDVDYVCDKVEAFYA
jgi:dTDP-4-amino-4,6-dideoxygalactose transaminase